MSAAAYTRIRSCLYKRGTFVKNHHLQACALWMAATGLSAFAAVKPVIDYGKLPLTFEANAGQTDGRVKYLSRGAGYTLFLTSGNEAVLSLARVTSKGERKSATVRMTMRGSTPASAIRPSDPRSTVSNYYQGQDSGKWLRDVRHFGRVTYDGVYPGVDAVYYGNQRQLE